MARIPIDFVVCGIARPRHQLPPWFQDNEQGPCVDCGRQLMWRPESPPAPRLCFDCARNRVKADSEPALILGPESLGAIMGEAEGSC